MDNTNRIDGLNYVFQDGEDLPVVFVHGWLGSIESWKIVRSQLKIENPKIFYDQRCHGESKCSKFSMKDLAADLSKIIETLCEEPPIIVGHSMGGMAALTYAMNYENISKLVLFGSCASTPEPDIESPEYFLKQFGEMNRSEWAEKIADNYLGRTEDSSMKETSIKELENAKEESIIYGLESMINYDIREQLKELEIDSKVISGLKDGAVTQEKSVELAELLNTEIQVLECGHLMLQEKPSKVAEIIERQIN